MLLWSEPRHTRFNIYIRYPALCNCVPSLQEIPYYMKSIDFGAEIDGTEDFFQMFWPVTVSQKSANSAN